MKLSKNNYRKVRDFVLINARMIQRRLFQFHFKTVKEWAALSTSAPLPRILEKYKLDIPWMQKAEVSVRKEIERTKEKHVFS